MIRRLLKHKTTKNAFWLTVVQVINYAAQIAIIPFLTRTLGVAEFGAAMAAIAATQLAFVVTDYGFSLSGTFEVSQKREQRARVQAIVSEIHSAKVALVVSALVGVVAVSYIPTYRAHQIIFLAACLSVIGKAYQPLWFFQGLEDMRTFATYMALAKLTYVVSVFALVHHSGDGYLVLVALGVADLVAAVVGLHFMRRLGFSPFTLSWAYALEGLRSSFHYFISRIAVALYTSASSIIVGAGSLTQAAAYASAEQVYKAGKSVTSPLNQALFPFMAKNHGPWLLLRIVPLIAVMLTVGTAVVYYFSNSIVIFAFGDNYSHVAPVLRIFLITVVVNYIGVSFGYPMFAALDSPRTANRTVIIGAVWHCIALMLLYIAGELSAITVALVVLGTESLVMFLRIFLSFCLINSRRAGKI